ncbi:MAG: Hpt domain-containing protein [Caldimonas sp.]
MLTKPIQLRALAAALERWMPEAAHAEAPAPLLPHAADKASPLPVDVSVLKSLVGDDMETVREFLSEFLVSAHQQAAEIVTSCHADDSRRVGAIAHKLKASSRSVGALALGDLCAELENACRAGGKAELAERCVRFEASMREVQSCIVDVLAEPTI